MCSGFAAAHPQIVLQDSGRACETSLRRYLNPGVVQVIHVGQGVNLLLTHWLWSLQSLRSLRTVHWVVATEPGERVPYTMKLNRETPSGVLVDARQVPDKPVRSVDEAE